MKEKLQQIASSNNWAFDYGRDDFSNLERVEDKEFYLFLDPLEELVSFDDSQEVGRTYNGRLLLLMVSDFDRVYDDQEGNNASEGTYERYIKRCKEEVMKIAKAFCWEYDILQWRMLEVINLYDTNFDGVLVNFQFKSGR